MPALDPTLRKTLESVVVRARDEAERASEAAINALAVGEKEPYASLGSKERRLRNRLRAKARQLGGGSLEAGLAPLVAECAFEQWHRMLFASFLAENGLLMHPEGVSVTLEECAELAPEEGDADAWATASRYAALMLPGIFGGVEPTLEVRLAPEGRLALEHALEEVPPPTFTSDDGLGWVYQFWQTKAKKEVNQSGRKIGGADLPAVTQLFTEDYMVKFLLHNTLGAWWAARHPESPIEADLDYLRRLDDGTPAAGTFPGWPATAAELKVLDPCCGSGHFLTAAADLLTRMRAEEERLDEAEAFEAVLRDNLFGLELDARCTQLAAFALALQAWKRGGYRELPIPNVACSGLAVGGRVEEWTRLADGDTRLEETLRRLHSLFRNAPDLGSLIDPSRVTGASELLAADFGEVENLLEKALNRERAQDDPTAAVFGEAVRGLVRAAALLKGHYHLVATNVPYLARGKQEQVLKEHLEKYHSFGKADLATAFVQRCGDYCERGCTYALVTPQNWLFLSSYKKLRERLLKEHAWEGVARLGSGAFETIGGEVVNVALVVLTRAMPVSSHRMVGLDVATARAAAEKAELLRNGLGQTVLQSSQLRNPDFRVTTEEIDQSRLLSRYTRSFNGVQSGDNQRFSRTFWELPSLYEGWVFQQSTVNRSMSYGGREHIFYWQNGRGDFYKFVEERLGEGRVTSWIRGLEAWGQPGIALSVMGQLPATLYQGQLYLDNTTAVIPKNRDHLPAIWTFCNSSEFNVAVRKINQKVSVNDGSAIKIPFDLEHWQKVADEQYPDGLPEPYSDDPTQWLFKGTVTDTTEPLQVAVARLLGYSWPDQAEDGVKPDADGIVCLPAVEDELPAAERLRSLLAQAYGEEWSPTLLDRLLADVGHGGKDLHTWLRDKFFAQHCKLFHNRPFIWHVWDGVKDGGFSALVNYHTLDRTRLERLIYTYLGDWIEAQVGAAKAGVTGADLRLAAAQDLKKRLVDILHGEPPYDIYVRWKPLREQPIGWEPDLNDGVRLNIRPFMQADVLRARLNIKWNKDRGKNPDGSERLNDLNFTRAEKEEARRKA